MAGKQAQFKVRRLNPKHKGPFNQGGYLETEVNKQGSIRVTAVKSGTVAQNLTLNRLEVDILLADLIRKGAGGELDQLADALAARGFGVSPPAGTESPPEPVRELTVPEIMELATTTIFSDQASIQAFAEDLGEVRLRRVMSALGLDDPSDEEIAEDGEDAVDDAKYFDKLAITVAEEPDRMKLLLQALERHGAFEIQAITPAAHLGHILTEQPEFVTDVTLQEDGSYGIALRTMIAGDERDELLKQIQEHVKSLGGKWKTRKKRGSSGQG